MIGNKLTTLIVLAVSAQYVLCDLDADIIVADTQVNKTYDNAEAFQVNIEGFNNVLFNDIVPYVNDIETRMYALGIDSVAIEDLDAKYDLYMAEIRSIIGIAKSEVGPLYLMPTSKTSYQLRNEISRENLEADVILMETSNEEYKQKFNNHVSEIDARIAELFIINWELIQGTSGPDREAINNDRKYIFDATTGYRNQLKDELSLLDIDIVQCISDVNVVIDQLP